MILQISSGHGPTECKLAVTLLLHSLEDEFEDIEVLSDMAALKQDSVMFQTKHDLSWLEGSIQWICKSPIRPHHKRKNWFIDVSRISSHNAVCEFNENDIKYESFRSGGKGGQHVNKVESGVRLIHRPTGISLVSTSERSQYLNKKEVTERLKSILKEIENDAQSQQKEEAWRAHQDLIRGNPVRVYEGPEFKLVKK
ncbi:MAG: peptide chain release factor H [Candidatus Izemoplasmatales bacterium]|nr:peptide chain release factor H [Candidatus Izemoplasmatales bacterium]